MRVTKLDYFIDKIVAATVENEKLRDKAFSQSKEINKLEEHIALLKERLIEHESSYLDATKAAFKRYIDAEGIRPNERFSKVIKRLQMYLPTDNELKEQLAHSYDSGLEAVHPEDTSEHYLPEPTPEEQEMYQENICQEIDAEQYE